MISYPFWAPEVVWDKHPQSRSFVHRVLAMLHDCTKVTSFYPTRLHILYKACSQKECTNVKWTKVHLHEKTLNCAHRSNPSFILYKGHNKITRCIRHACTHYTCSCHIHTEHSKTGEVGAIALHHCDVPILWHCGGHSICRPSTAANSFGKQ